jgi:protein-S-isoprenylcysteine O-methyltransferase Ste14
MVEAVIRALIGLLLLALCVFLVIWVLSIIGMSPPPTVVNIIYAIAVLIGILILYRVIRPHAGNWLP